MKKVHLFMFIMLLVTLQLPAQYYTNQNKVWVFGKYCGINFTSGTPTPFTTSINQYEGCASISNAAGVLLFYTDGKTVWDRTGSIMPHGNAVVPYNVASCAQPAVIVPVSGNPDKYYLFSLEEQFIQGRLDYSTVDMSLNGGNGDVVSATIATPLDSGLSEKMICVAGNFCDFWLIVHDDTLPRFKAYNISAGGISSPVISTSGSFTSSLAYYGSGVMKVSPSRRKIVVTSHYYSPHTELFDFDPSTGVVSGCQLLSTASSYGAEFSPDNSRLYATTIVGVGSSISVDQYDITLGSTAAIAASKVTVSGSTCFAGDLKLGPDGKIYIANFGSGHNTMDRIDTPNAAGLACGYEIAAVTLPGVDWCQLGLPNVVYTLDPGDTTSVRHDTVICLNAWSSVTLSAHDTAAVSRYLWNDGTTTTRTKNIGAAGIYWVKIINQCNLTIDTIHVFDKPVTGPITGPDSVCRFMSITLLDTTAGGTWRLSNVHASITVGGVVTGGMTAGLDTVFYKVTNVCGTDSVQKILKVNICEGGVPGINGIASPAIFPNPGKGNFTIRLSSDIDEQVQIVISNILGQKVKEFTASTNNDVNFDLKERAGIYLLSATIEHQRFVVKVVVE